MICKWQLNVVPQWYALARRFLVQENMSSSMMKKAFLTQVLLFLNLPIFAQENSITPVIQSQSVNQEKSITLEPNWHDQRQLFLKIQQLLPYSEQTNVALLISQLLEKIKDYPLYPEAKFQFLIKNKALAFENIEAFAQQYPHMTEQINQLTQHWLSLAQQTQDWQAILQHQGQLPTNLQTQCVLLQANGAKQIRNKQEQTNWTQQVQQIWLTGDNLPTSCNEVVESWQKENLNAALIQQRALLAFSKNNIKLLNQLRTLTVQSDLIQWLEELIKIQQRPTHLLSEQSWFNPENAHYQAEIAQAIFIQQMPQIIKKSEKPNPQAPFEFYANLAKSLQLEEKQISAWKKLLISQLFDNEDPQIQQWRDETVIQLKEDSLTERRIRLAIRNKEDYARWITLLSEITKQKDEWQFWQAKLWQKQGALAPATVIFQQLKSGRGFYPMLASMELNLPYQPKMQNAIPNSENHLAQNFARPLARVSEFRWLGDYAKMNKEWKKLLEQGDFNHKLQLAHYAQQHQWFDLAVDATIQAKAWDYLALRLPNAYLDFFDIHLAGKPISRTFAMALARQESAWKTYVSSSANAKGLMQLLPSTAKQTAQQAKLPYRQEAQLLDPFDNIMLGTTHLSQLYQKYGNNRVLIAAAYNAGSHRVDQWLTGSNGKLSLAEFVASIPFFETRGYVQNVLTYDAYYQILQQQPQMLLNPQESQRLY
ncbi:transglycosylase SLT domain-containing protein [[Haemophilus] felis]|nr:transglycosylase SLT domain-containing protein [[Haemophilus] felis]